MLILGGPSKSLGAAVLNLTTYAFLKPGLTVLCTLTSTSLYGPALNLLQYMRGSISLSGIKFRYSLFAASVKLAVCSSAYASTFYCRPSAFALATTFSAYTRMARRVSGVFALAVRLLSADTNSAVSADMLGMRSSTKGRLSPSR
jgi:hypothetical protein